jgi:hypothetical protein
MGLDGSRRRGGASGILQPVKKPGARDSVVAYHGSQFHHLRLTRVQSLQLVKCVIEVDQVDRIGFGGHEISGRRKTRVRAAMSALRIHQGGGLQQVPRVFARQFALG